MKNELYGEAFAGNSYLKNKEQKMERDKCDSCKYAMSVGDAFSKYGLITQMEYKVYTRSAYPDWPVINE